MKLFFIPFIFLLSLSIKAQTDSILLSKKIDSLKELGFLNYKKKDYIAYKNILSKSKKTGYNEGILKSYMEIFEYFSNLKNIDSSFYYSQQIEIHQKAHPNKDLNKKHLIAAGHIFIYNYNFPEYALPYYMDAQKCVIKKILKHNLK